MCCFSLVIILQIKRCYKTQMGIGIAFIYFNNFYYILDFTCSNHTSILGSTIVVNLVYSNTIFNAV